MSFSPREALGKLKYLSYLIFEISPRKAKTHEARADCLAWPRDASQGSLLSSFLKCAACRLLTIAVYLFLSCFLVSIQRSPSQFRPHMKEKPRGSSEPELTSYPCYLQFPVLCVIVFQPEVNFHIFIHLKSKKKINREKFSNFRTRSEQHENLIKQ